MELIYKNFLKEKNNNFNLEYYSIRKDFSFKKEQYNKKEFVKKVENIILNLEKYSHFKKFTIILENNVDIIFLIYSLMLLGKKIIIINPDELKDVKKNILSKNKDSILISRKILNEFKKKHLILPVKKLFRKNKNKINLLKHIKKKKIRNISLSYCSSGTTSSPKLINLTELNMRSQLNQINERLKIKSFKNKFLTAMPCTHISAFFFIFLNGIIFDKKLIFLNYFNPLKFLQLLSREKLSLVYLNPTMIEILNQYIRKFINLKKTTILCGSAPLSKNTLEKFIQKSNCKFIHLYGLTETTNTACVTPPNRKKGFYKNLYFDENTPSIGKPLKGCEIKLLRNNKIILNEKEIGEFIIKGPNVIRPLKNYKNYGFNFKKEYLKTGDVGFFKKIKNETFFYITGRKKEMIIKNGINIYLNEIDSFLKSKGLARTVAIKKASRFSGEDYILVTDSHNEFKKKFKIIISKLPKYMRTNKIILVQELLKTISGKLKKNLISETIVNMKNFSLKEKDF